MREIASRVDVKSDKYKENVKLMQAKVKELDALIVKGKWQGEERHIAKAKKAGKMLARDRIEMVLDKGTASFELLPLAGHGRDSFALGGTMTAVIGIVSGISLISGFVFILIGCIIVEEVYSINIK